MVRRLSLSRESALRIICILSRWHGLLMAGHNAASVFPVSILVSAKGLLDTNRNPSREEVRDWFQKHRQMLAVVPVISHWWMPPWMRPRCCVAK